MKKTAEVPHMPLSKPGLIVFVLIAVVGLSYVKWFPYYDRAIIAASKHLIGNSILMGTAASAPVPSWLAAIDYAITYGKAIWQALVLGLLLGSAVQALLPPRWIARALGGTSFGSVLAGGLTALPGMMCTCCAAPVVAGLRERRASPGGAAAFWLGNSVLNPATLVFIGFVLGWSWAMLRLILGVMMVFGIGYLLNRLAAAGGGGIGSERPVCESFVAMNSDDDSYGRSVFKRWGQILIRMTVRLIPEYFVLVLLLGAVRAWLFPHIGPDIGNHLIWIAALSIAGAIFVIPTAGEVPIIQAMLSLGMSVGPAGALLMTLPPISLPSVAMLAKSFKPAQMGIIIVAVMAFGVLGGVLAAAFGF